MIGGWIRNLPKSPPPAAVGARFLRRPFQPRVGPAMISCTRPVPSRRRGVEPWGLGPGLAPELTSNPQCCRRQARQGCSLIETAWRQLVTACATRHLPLVLLFLFTWFAAAQAQDYTWAINDGTVTITGYNGPGGAVTIPNSHHWAAGHQHRGLRVRKLQQPHQRHHQQRGDEHWRRGVLFLHQPGERDNPGYRDEHRRRCVRILH